MKFTILKLSVVSLLMTVSLSFCGKITNDENSDDDNLKMVSIKIECSQTGAVDFNIVSFALPGIVEVRCTEHPPQLGFGTPEGLSPHVWAIALVMAEGSDVTQLAPTITLVPGATITWIHTKNDKEQVISKQVNYTGIADVGVADFSKQVDYVVIAPDGSTVIYMFLASAIGDPVQYIDGVDDDGEPNIIIIYPDDPRYPY